MWEGDPLVEETYKALGVKPVPLSITDVLMSLQTGLLDTVYSSPQGAIGPAMVHQSEIHVAFADGLCDRGGAHFQKKIQKSTCRLQTDPQTAQ